MTNKHFLYATAMIYKRLHISFADSYRMVFYVSGVYCELFQFDRKTNSFGLTTNGNTDYFYLAKNEQTVQFQDKEIDIDFTNALVFVQANMANVVLTNVSNELVKQLTRVHHAFMFKGNKWHYAYQNYADSHAVLNVLLERLVNKILI